MACPQKENGFTAIANEIMEKLYPLQLSGSEWQIVLYILRKTYGWHKTEDNISLSQFSKDIKTQRKSICRSLKNLIEKHIIIVVSKTTLSNRYKFNKNWEEWVVSKMTPQCPKCPKGSVNSVPKVVPKLTHTKDIITKDNIQKIYTETDVSLTENLYTLVKRNYPFIKDKTNKDKDYVEMNRINRLDGYTYEQIDFIIKWCQQDEFWKQNIRSVSKLREKFEELVVRVKGKIDKRKVINYDK